MAWTAHKTDDAVLEHFDSPEVLDAKAAELAAMIRASTYMVAFTGAGVSTSAGIPDFRGPQGAWTLAANGMARTAPVVVTQKAMATATHMSLVQLQNAGILKRLISQNCDGLHRRSGMLPENISELHGNSNLERCRKCGKEYLRDFDATASYHESVFDHRTNRVCSVPGCFGDLHDSIINFGENLPERPLMLGMEASERADLHLVLGSSLTVSPACKMPQRTAKRGGALVICNLQKTPLDHLAKLRIFAKTDDLMRRVMALLMLPIPPFLLTRRVLTCYDSSERVLSLRGVDSDGLPFSFVQQAHLLGDAGTVVATSSREPHAFRLSRPPAAATESALVRLDFFNHYNEPALELPVALQAHKDTEVILTYSPVNGLWTVTPPGVPFLAPAVAPAAESSAPQSSLLSTILSAFASPTSAPPTAGLPSVPARSYALTVGNSAVRVDDANVQWTVFVTGPLVAQRLVSAAVFELHPTFSPSTVTVNTLSVLAHVDSFSAFPAFALSRLGWGEFVVNVRLVLASGQTLFLEHQLSFDGRNDRTYEYDLIEQKLV